ncbi:Exonuclease SbcC [Limosilactobacillus reuteri]|uniref:Exonuclease SbcC n=2 Tax=Limosilactobacillus reuteri TaxID=1598 RepID=A0A0U5JX57_LIMRT|nr:Exonuclease SbcC [Limosilactobacillus reuteri]
MGDDNMSIKCTVTTDLQAKDKNGYSGIQKHVEHDKKINHTNQDIVFSETQFNQYDKSPKTRAAIDQWNNEHFKDYVEEHDKHQREKGHAERQYGSVKNYLKRKKKATAVLTIGNMEVQSKLMQQFCPKTSYQEEKLPDGTTHLVFKLKDQSSQPIPDNIAIAKQFYGCFNRALIKATNNNVGWTLKDKSRVNVGDYLHRGRYATNNDEMGISHIHYELATFGMTRGGKKRAAHVTNSLNQALVSLHHAVTGKYCSGRDATKWFRANMDQFALKCLEDELHKTYKVPQNKKILDFERKTKEDKAVQTGLSMEQLKAQHQEIADHQKAVQSLQSQADNLTNQKNDVQSQVATVIQNLKSIYEATTGHQAVDKDGNDLSPLEMAKGITRANRAAQDDKEKAEQAKATADQERQKAEQQKAQQEQQLATQRQQLKVLQDQLDEANNQLKRRKQQRIKNAQKEIAQNELTDGNNQPINVTEDNVAQIEQEIDNWRQDQQAEWTQDKTDAQHELEQINQQLLKAHSTKANLESTNQELTRQNTQLQQSQQLMKNNINGYKNQLVDMITKHDPNHKVEQQLLKPNEVPEAVITTNGRQQHLRQPLKYLIDVTTQVLQKIKTTATNFINQVTKSLLPPVNPKKPIQLQSSYVDFSKIQASLHKPNAQKEIQLMNDPIIKLKRAVLTATTDQLQKANEKTKKSIKQQFDDEWKR